MEKLIAKLNAKIMKSCFSDSMVYFIDGDINEISENENEIKNIGYYAVSDGVNMIDFKENVMDDISKIYGVTKHNDMPYNLSDFYSVNGFYNENTSETKFLKSFDIFKDR
jgi:hypothetical protein